MSYFIHLTHNWPSARLAPYESAISAAMARLAARFPDDISPIYIAQELLSGQRQLWLVLNENDDFVAFLTSHIETTARGRKRLFLLELAGYGGLKLVKLLSTIESWAQSQAIDEIIATGRWGWSKAMRGQGFCPDLIHYKKEISHGKPSKRQ